MRLFTEGFEMGDGYGWTSYTTDSGRGSISSTYKRSGAYGMYCVNWTLSEHGYVDFTASAEVYMSIGTNAPVGSTYIPISLKHGTTRMLGVRLRGGVLEYWIGATLTTVRLQDVAGTPQLDFEPDQWYLVEIYHKVDATVGRIVIKVDGFTYVDFTGNTVVSAQTTDDRFAVGPQGYRTTANWFDDIAINNTDNSDSLGDTSWPGDIHIEALAPNGNGAANQFVGQDADSTNNYLNVDEAVSDGDTTYNESNTVTDQDMYDMTDWDATAKTVDRVYAEARAKDTLAGAANMKIGVRTASTVYTATKALPADYLSAVRGTAYKNNPNSGSAWSNAELDAVQFVAEVV